MLAMSIYSLGDADLKTVTLFSQNFQKENQVCVEVSRHNYSE